MIPHVAVIGSRDFDDYEFMCSILDQIERPFQIVSGGAPGADRLAEKYSREKLGMEPIVFPANWFPQGRDGPLDRGAGYKRNPLIINKCDRAIAFWNGISDGTKHSVGLARKADKPVDIYWPG